MTEGWGTVRGVGVHYEGVACSQGGVGSSRGTVGDEFVRSGRNGVQSKRNGALPVCCLIAHGTSTLEARTFVPLRDRGPQA